jgi:hypothetical protein
MKITKGLQDKTLVSVFVPFTLFVLDSQVLRPKSGAIMQ